MRVAISTIAWYFAIGFAAANEPSASAPTEHALRDESLRRVKQDQDLRLALVKWLKEHGDPAGTNLSEQQKEAYGRITRRLQEVDATNTKWLKRVVSKHGWPTYSMVGKDGGQAAWLLVQHADADVKFQRRCLDLMTKLPTGEVSPADVAYLTDRVLLADGKKQLYGTQFVAKDGTFVPRPLEDAANVDRRRASKGLPPLKEYIQQIEKAYGQGANELGLPPNSNMPVSTKPLRLGRWFGVPLRVANSGARSRSLEALHNRCGRCLCNAFSVFQFVGGGYPG